MQIKYNTSPRMTKIEYIVIHDTGNTNKGANALMHFNYFNNDNRNASADFFVDDTQALQVNDYTKNYTWHCGDGKGQYGIFNSNSIGIEICINSDGDYEKAVSNTIELVKKLMNKLNIDIKHVIKHYDASHKICPGSMSKNNWAKWNDFKYKLKEDPNEWKFEGLKGLYKEGLLNDFEDWSNNIDKPMPVWAVTIILNRIYQKLKG